MAGNNALLAKIGRAFLVQAALIGLAAIMSVFFAKIVLEQVLIKEAIEQEAEYFWQNYLRDNTFGLPDTSNLTGFLVEQDLPGGVRDVVRAGAGFYEYEDDATELVVHVSTNDDRSLYLLYNRGQVDSLAAYYGLFPLAIVLVVLYLSVWSSYVVSRRALSPVSRLARHVNSIDFTSPDFRHIEIDRQHFGTNDEIEVLTQAIENLAARLDAFIARERNFTRDASHELRSPLTVISIAVDMLMSEHELDESAQELVQRIGRSVRDMDELVQAFLLLARESNDVLSFGDVCVNDVVSEEIERARMMNPDKVLEVNLLEEQRLMVLASDKVLSVLIGNLIRNAFIYTEKGSIDITIGDNRIVITDSGRGMPTQQVEEMFKPYQRGENNNVAGQGVGLTIVKRLSDRFQWPVRIESEPGVGTRVEVRF